MNMSGNERFSDKSEIRNQSSCDDDYDDGHDESDEDLQNEETPFLLSTSDNSSAEKSNFRQRPASSSLSSPVPTTTATSTKHNTNNINNNNNNPSNALNPQHSSINDNHNRSSFVRSSSSSRGSGGGLMKQQQYNERLDEKSIINIHNYQHHQSTSQSSSTTTPEHHQHHQQSYHNTTSSSNRRATNTTNTNTTTSPSSSMNRARRTTRNTRNTTTMNKRDMQSFMKRYIHLDEEEAKDYDRRSWFTRLMHSLYTMFILFPWQKLKQLFISSASSNSSLSHNNNNNNNNNNNSKSGGGTTINGRKYFGRTVYLNGYTLPHGTRYPANIVRNQKYNILLFVPMVLFEQFKFFFNLYFLLVAVTQFIPQLKVGFLFTYVAPLIFVLSITMAKEAFDDVKRWRRDVEANSQKYQRLNPVDGTLMTIPSSRIQVGDMIQIHSNMRVPADCILLRTTEKSGASFIRTDQLDGETDWKLRHAVPSTQALPYDESLCCGHLMMMNNNKNNNNNSVSGYDSDGGSSSSTSDNSHTTTTIGTQQSFVASVYAEAPRREIYDFIGTFTRYHTSTGEVQSVESLSLENTMWANTVVASGTVIALVIYTGGETRSVLNTSAPSSKTGLLDRELNTLSKFLFILMLVLSLIMVALKRFQGLWFITLFRFVLLFSSIIPISLRVNLDVAKSVYSFFMMRDSVIPGTIVRNSSIPEELGRIEYLFTDKTGTLTQNEMIFKELHMGTVAFKADTLDDIEQYLKGAYRQLRLSPSQSQSSLQLYGGGGGGGGRNSGRQQQQQQQQQGILLNMDDDDDGNDDNNNAIVPLGSSSSSPYTSNTSNNNSNASSSSYYYSKEEVVLQMIEALALCHNVTPVVASSDDGGEGEGDAIAIGGHNIDPSSSSTTSSSAIGPIVAHNREYQASSPDEIALVKFTESVGLVLQERSLNQMTICHVHNDHSTETFDILLLFPFTSESKRMGIIVQSQTTGRITFYCKGADVIMKRIVRSSNWLDEECGNLALAGLRTLVFAKKELTRDEFDRFFRVYNEAKACITQDRAQRVDQVRTSLEQGMELLGVTGVEDLLQHDVQKSLVEIRNAGIKVWMLTGDKEETATCIARSTRLVSNRTEIVSLIAPNKSQAEVKLFDAMRGRDSSGGGGPLPLIIDGSTLQICLDQLRDKFVSAVRQAPAVICCRCAPTQKAAIVELMKQVTGKRTAAIGDGGNDVSMIQAADVGLGIVGKEGKHASLAADFSINQFSYCTQLILWHGRNSYKRSARLSQFVIHRGLIISIIQAVFSAIYYFAAIPVFTGWLIVGYSTLYTMFPVLTIVFDEDVTRNVAFQFPELYTDLQLGRVLSFRTFLTWVWKAVYQGGIIMLLAIFLFESNFLRIQSISFTALILTELVLVVLEVHKVNFLMILSEILSIGIYIGSIFLLPSYFDIPFILSPHFWWKVLVIVTASCLPILVVKVFMRFWNPPAWRKVK